MEKIRVLVVDDSALMRKKVRELLESDRNIEVVGIARDGEDGVLKARDLRPDVITMDINMPVMDGLSALCYVVEEEICPVIMLSSLTQEGASTTFEAMELGAFDFVPKPGGTVSLDIEYIRDDLLRKVYAAAGLETKPLEGDDVTPKITSKVPKTSPDIGFKAVCIGISTGGPKTIFDVLPKLPADINAAIFLVQHMPPGFTETFARRLNSNCAITVKESAAGDEIEPGTCYLVKGGYHLSLYKKHSGLITARLNKRPKHTFMPSVDIVMMSVLETFGPDTMGVIMTGMGSDGADAMVNVKRSGGYTIAESPESCVVHGMPKETVERGGASIVLPAGHVAAEISKRVKSGW